MTTIQSIIDHYVIPALGEWWTEWSDVLHDIALEISTFDPVHGFTVDESVDFWAVVERLDYATAS